MLIDLLLKRGKSGCSIAQISFGLKNVSYMKAFSVPSRLLSTGNQAGEDKLFTASSRKKYNKQPPIDLKSVRTSKQKEEYSGKRKESRFFPMVLLSIPLLTFGLGCWQIQRRKQKIELIDYLNSRTKSEPIELPNNLENLVDNYEYRPFKVKGHFIHSREIVLTPKHDMTGTYQGVTGGWVITPFLVSNRPDLLIMVNRGFVPYTHFSPEMRREAQVDQEVELVGLLRSDELKTTFTPLNKPPFEWHHRNIQEMAKHLGTAPIFLDTIQQSKSAKSNIPIGGQTVINIRNEHLSYIVTWFSLSALTSYMWYTRFARLFF
jgi:surfeit locus 1 family protein